MTLYLDLDGPILDVSERYYRTHQSIIRASSAAPLSKSAFWELKRARTSTRSILARSGAAAVSEDDYRRGWLERIESWDYLLLDRVFPGVEPLLKIWKDQHRLVLVTLRQRADLLMAQLECFGLLQFFSDVLSASPHDQPGWKTKQRLIESHAPNLQLGVIIGDTENDIRAGKSLRIMTIAVLCGIRNREFIEKEMPDYILEDLSCAPEDLKVSSPAMPVE